MEKNMQTFDDYQEGMRRMPEIEVTRIAEGLGYGEGTISHAEQTDIDVETMAKAEAVITSDEILVPVDTDKNGNMLDDDGCGDGRGVKSIVEGMLQRLKSLHRPKVFGGAPAMAVASQIGLGRAKGKTLVQTFKAGINILKDKMIGYGGHTDEHAHGPNCGCGAIDKAPAIVANAVKYETEIRSSIDVLAIPTDGLDDVFGEFRDYAGEIVGQDYSGREVMGGIIDDGKVVKELEGDHKEKYIVLNTRRGYTVNQELVRRVTDGKVQVFGVDVWRMQDLSARKYANESPEVQHRAFLSELVYTLAVAATLTKGDLPVYVASEVPQPAAA